MSRQGEKLKRLVSYYCNKLFSLNNFFNFNCVIAYDFFAVGYILAKEMRCNPIEALVVCDANYSLGSYFTLHPVTEQDIIRHSAALGDGSIRCFDAFQLTFLKTTFSIFLNLFLQLVNLSIATRKFPEIYKLASVFLLNKSNDYQDKNNYYLQTNFSAEYIL